MGRSPCCAKEGLNRGAWTAMEDKILIEYIKAHGEGRWRNLPKRAGLKRCGKSCRLRWLNYLRPDIKRGNITPDEEELIIRLHKLLGNRWSLIAGRLPGRTDNEIKNYWNTNLSKRINHLNNDQTTNRTQEEPQTNSTKTNKASKFIEHKQSPQTLESNNVVRTKAFRCSKVFINPDPELESGPNLDQLEPEPESQLEPQLLRVPQSKEQFGCASNANSSIDHGSWARLNADYNEIPSDFMLENLNMEDFKLISDLASTDFLGDCGFDSESLNSVSDFSSDSLEQPFVFSQELLEDWLGDQEFK